MFRSLCHPQLEKESSLISMDAASVRSYPSHLCHRLQCHEQRRMRHGKCHDMLIRTCRRVQDQSWWRSGQQRDMSKICHHRRSCDKVLRHLSRQQCRVDEKYTELHLLDESGFHKPTTANLTADQAQHKSMSDHNKQSTVTAKVISAHLSGCPVFDQLRSTRK